MKKILLFALALCTMVPLANAGGFKIGLQGQKQIGMGHTGIGLAQDAASIYFNPAAISFVGNQVNFGVSGIVPRTQFLDANTNVRIDAVNQFFTPFSLYANYHFKNTPLTAGIGVYTPFGSGIQYPGTWAGRFILTEISLQAVYIQPTLSYKASENISIGAGVVYAAGNMELKKNIPLAANSISDEGNAQLTGDAHGWGYNLGVYFKAGKNITAGVTYHSRVDMKVDQGNAVFNNIPSAAASSFPNTTFSTELPLPSELGVGGGFKLNKDLTLAVDLNYTFWNSFKSLGFNYADNTDKLTDEASPRLYKNAWAARAGLQWDASKRTTVRCGILYDRTPVQEGYVNPELPDNDKAGAALGFTYWLENRFSIEGSLMYEDVARRTDFNLETQLHGTYRTKVVIPGIGINYMFGNKVKKRVNKL